jgi:hypothetical protein
MFWDAFYKVMQILGSDVYVPHSYCLAGDPVLMTLYLSGDFVIFLSYVVIGVSLMFTDPTRINLTPAMRVMYGAFIFFCGLSHFTKTMTLFSGIYRLDVLVVFITAAVSAVCAVITAQQAISSKGTRLA